MHHERDRMHAAYNREGYMQPAAGQDACSLEQDRTHAASDRAGCMQPKAGQVMWPFLLLFYPNLVQQSEASRKASVPTLCGAVQAVVTGLQSCVGVSYGTCPTWCW